MTKNIQCSDNLVSIKTDSLSETNVCESKIEETTAGEKRSNTISSFRLWGRGAYIADSDEAERTIRSWLHSHEVEATGFSETEADVFVFLVERGKFDWVVLASAGRSMTFPWFNRLFRATIETETEILSADDNLEFGLHLFCSMVANWEFFTPYCVEESEGTSLTSIRDALCRIERRDRDTTKSDANSSGIEWCDLSIEENVTADKGGLAIKDFTVFYDGKKCFLGNTLLSKLFEFLVQARGRWCEFRELRSQIWGDPHTTDETIGRTIRSLRQQLKRDGLNGIVIQNPRERKHHVRLIVS